MLHSTDVNIKDDPKLVGQTVDDIKRERDQVVVAIKRDGHYYYAPEPETLLEQNDILIVLGTSANQKKAAAELRTRY